MDEWLNSAGNWVNNGLFGQPVGGIAPANVDPEMIDRMTAEMVDQINTLGGILPEKFAILYFAFAVIAFFVALSKMMWLRSIKPVAEFFTFYIFIMVLLLVSENWNMMADGWAGWMSRTAFQAVGYDFTFMAPSVVLAEGFRIIFSLYDSGISFYRIFFGSSDDSIAGLILLLSLGGLAWAVIQMVAVLVVMMVFFKISSLLALCLLPFLLLGMTRFMSAPGVVRVIQYGLQFFVVGLIIGLVFRFVGNWTFSDRPTANEVVTFAISVGVLCVLMKHGMTVAKEHIAGTPMLSMREGAGALSEGVTSLNRSVNQLTRTMVNHSRMVGHGGGVGGAVSDAARNRFRIGGGDNGAANVNRIGSAGGGAGGGSPGRWAAEPTTKQQAAAKARNVDLSGMNRAQASEALEKSGLGPLQSSAPNWAKRAGGSNNGSGKI